MPRLAIYADKTINELIDSYELATTDLANSHKELSEAQSALHSHYLEIWAGSQGKTVAERNRTADYATRNEYSEVIKIRGDINRLSVQREMLANLISWKLKTKPSLQPSTLLEYPPNHDEGMIGNGRK